MKWNLCFASMNQGQVSHIAVGLDLTDRAAQREARPEGLPWARGKAFRGAARIGGFVPWAKDVAGLSTSGLHLELRIDGEVRQSRPGGRDVHRSSGAAERSSRVGALTDGDVVFTGTPSGVGRLHPGQTVAAVLQDADDAVLSRLDLRCV